MAASIEILDGDHRARRVVPDDLAAETLAAVVAPERRRRHGALLVMDRRPARVALVARRLPLDAKVRDLDLVTPGVVARGPAVTARSVHRRRAVGPPVRFLGPVAVLVVARGKPGV